MTNQLTNALVSAGFPKMSHGKRIWLWLHDHPGKTVTEIEAALGISQSTNAAVYLRDMLDRGMVSRVKAHRRNSGSGAYEYSTCIREYELLPKTKRATQALKNQAAYGPAVSARMPIEDLTPQPIEPSVSAQPIDIKALSLVEAYRLYNELCIYFGSRA